MHMTRGTKIEDETDSTSRPALEPTRYTLLTNVSCVVHLGLRLRVSAIVIALDGSGQETDPRRQRVRMFGPSPSWPICDVDVPLLPHVLVERRPPGHVPPGSRLSQRVYDLRFADPIDAVDAIAGSSKFEILTQAMDGRPIDVQEFPSYASINMVWGEIVPAVRRSWHAPNFPTITWSRTE
jgi:hypothetical protein